MPEYKGQLIHPCGPNSSGMRWWAFHPAGLGILKADTMRGLKTLITDALTEGA